MFMKLDIVVAGYIAKDKKVLLIDHKKLKQWLPVGGHIEKNETPDDALRREIKEELDLKVNFVHYPDPKKGNNKEYALPFYVNKHHIKEKHEHYCLFYLCTPKSNSIKPNMQEIDGYRWFSKEDLSDKRVSKSVKLIALEAISLVK